MQRSLLRRLVFNLVGRWIVMSRNGSRGACVAALAAVALVSAVAGAEGAVRAGGGGAVAANNNSYMEGVSADGRFVAFDSEASNLVAGRHERQLGRVRARPRGGHDRAGEREQRGRAGERRGGRQRNPAISADGRFVAFDSDASNLVAGDTNGPGTCSCATGRRGRPSG